MARNKTKKDVNIAHAAGILGKKGGHARAEVLTKWRRTQIAREGGKARQHEKKVGGRGTEKSPPT